MRTRPGLVEPDVCFRVVHGGQVGHHGNVVELLRKAIEWQAPLESGRIAAQHEIARQEGITRARVTQVLGMLRLDPAIQDRILSRPAVARRPSVSERTLRSRACITISGDPLQEFHEILT